MLFGSLYKGRPVQKPKNITVVGARVTVVAMVRGRRVYFEGSHDRDELISFEHWEEEGRRNHVFLMRGDSDYWRQRTREKLHTLYGRCIW